MDNYNNNNTAALSWDSVIQEESSGFVLLPAGEYDFKVISMNRAFHNGSDKLPKCPKAELEIELTIHMDPIILGNPDIDKLQAKIIQAVHKLDKDLKIHDFRVVTAKGHSNVIFDVSICLFV